MHLRYYVVHVRDGGGGGWVLMDDEKVLRADDESMHDLKMLAYLYMFERVYPSCLSLSSLINCVVLGDTACTVV